MPEPQLGIRMSARDSEAYVSQLNVKVLQRWNERVTQGPLMTHLMAGTLPLSVIRLFFRNWGVFTIEINTLIAASYHKHIGFLKRHVDLLGPFGAKIADEFVNPIPPGHVMVMLKTAAALGLSEQQILREPMLPEARIVLDFKRGLLWEGTVAEWWFSIMTEEPIGHWSAAWFRALTTHYGMTREQAIYFATHEEADLKEHADGVMGHGSFNKTVMHRILEDGYADTRAGYSLEYCALATVDLYGLMHKAVYDYGMSQAEPRTAH